MKFESYDEYVKATEEYYKNRELSIPAELMILPEDLFNIFNGVIEFGAGSMDLVNKETGCTCSPTIKEG